MVQVNQGKWQQMLTFQNEDKQRQLTQSLCVKKKAANMCIHELAPAPLDAAYVSSSSHGEKLIIRIALSFFSPSPSFFPNPPHLLRSCHLFLSSLPPYPLTLPSLCHLSSVAAGADQSQVEAKGDGGRGRAGWRGSISVFSG